MYSTIKKLFIASTTATVGVAVATTASVAQVTQDINFTGTILSICSFANVDAGTLDVDFVTDVTVLSSTVGTGTAGTVDLTCTSNSTLQVGVPADNGSDATPGGTATAQAELTEFGGGNLTITDADGATNVTGPIVGQTVTVNMTIDDTNPIVPGDYNYNVTLTATPL